MSVAIKKINCPNPDHEDAVASCAVYEKGDAYCFGCQTYFKEVEKPVKQEVFKEDLDAKIYYIRNLPIREIRGLKFPFDDKGYYIQWPDSHYYKLRRWDDSDGRGRYVSPSGHFKPPYILNCKYWSLMSDVIVFVEGEINAASLATIFPCADIVSPGGVSSFTDKYMINELPTLVNYAKIYICVDADAAGLEAAIKLKTLARQYCSNITINLMEKDFNQILIERGKDGIKEEFEAMEMRARVQSR